MLKQSDKMETLRSDLNLATLKNFENSRLRKLHHYSYKVTRRSKLWSTDVFHADEVLFWPPK